MKKLLSLILVFLLCACPALAEQDELLLFDILEDANPDIVADTVIIPTEPPEPTEEELQASYQEHDGSVLITLTATGDFTIGGDSRKKADIFNDELKKHDGDINFTMQNIRDILLADDLTIVNFEGTLTNSTYVPSNKKNNDFLFSAPPSYVTMLSDNGVEAASLENNHIMDHGQEAYEDTQEALDSVGIVWSNSEHVGVIEVKGIQIAMLSYLCIDRYDKLWDKVPADIAEAKAKYPIVIVNFHWGFEKDYFPGDQKHNPTNQLRMGRLAVDAGADLVIGNHSHRFNPIEYYNGVYICYSLGNFCFSGNAKPSDMSSYLFQTRFRVREDSIENEGFRIIPIRISSRTDRNDFIPTPLTKETAIDSMLNTLRENGKRLEYAVDDYPLTW